LSKETQTFDSVQRAYNGLITAIMPQFAKVMQNAYGDGWIGHAIRHAGPSSLPPALCPGQTIIEAWKYFAPTFPQDDLAQTKKSIASLVEVRLEISKAEQTIEPEVGLRLLQAIRQVAFAFGALALTAQVGELVEKQRALTT
jgi:hypothetical protein